MDRIMGQPEEKQTPARAAAPPAGAPDEVHDDLGMAPELMLDLARRAAELVVARIRDLPGENAWDGEFKQELMDRLMKAPPEAGRPPLEVIEQAARDILPLATRLDHPRCFGFVPSSPTWPGVLADFMAAGYHLNVCSWLVASGPSQLELVVIDWFRRWIGYPEGAGGLLTSGGSAASVDALVAAREAAGPARLRGRLRCSFVLTTIPASDVVQRFKTIYFPDHPGVDARRNLKLAFGPADDDLYRAAAPLASEELRRLLGCESYSQLRAAAEARAVSVNRYGVERLRSVLSRLDPRRQLQAHAIQPVTAAVGHAALDLNPIHATFRGGAAEPLHDWYPFLEGYSPDFVRNVLAACAPDARRVLDPFAGTGTTPLTVAQADKEGFYCELSPLLQLLVETKSAVLAVSDRERGEIARRLSALAQDLVQSLAAHEPDRALAEAYAGAFGDSAFFSPQAFDCSLRLRTWLDSLAHEAAPIADLAAVAVLRSLVPCSNMIRRGDLRFRRGAERLAVRSDLAGEAAARMGAMARDIVDLGRIAKSPVLVTSDAKLLDRVPGLEVDAIVTSPPYLNGTNYYRNTKIELWFLRTLTCTADLTAFREATVTAGINDVVGTRRREPVTASVERLVQQLDERAYDRRIPTMVARYFADMRQVFHALSYHVARGAVLAMDIGDSCYAGVHVDTPRILGELLSAQGWVLRPEYTLRRRVSRSRQPLRQVLMTAHAPAPARGLGSTQGWSPGDAQSHAPEYPTGWSSAQTTASEPPPWQAAWDRFKADLPHRRDDYRRRNWGNPLHSLCSYQGKLKPSLAHHLVAIFASPGGRLLDPFGGVGTIAFEAAVGGVTAWSFDLSPAAVAIARAKLDPPTLHQCLSVLQDLEAFIRTYRPTECERSSASSLRFNGRLPDYYHPRTFDEILAARRYFLDDPPVDAGPAMVFSSLLHVLHGNRPYALSRRSHPITPFAPSGEAHYRSLIDRVGAKVERALAVDVGARFVPGLSLFQDATDSWPRQVDELDAVITSPPFYDSTRFYLSNWIRLWFSGWNEVDFRDRPSTFVDERQKRGFEVYRPVLRQARERLKPNGVLVLHLGRSRKCDMAAQISRISGPWFRSAEVFVENVSHCESHGIRDKGTVSEHVYLVLT